MNTTFYSALERTATDDRDNDLADLAIRYKALSGGEVGLLFLRLRRWAETNAGLPEDSTVRGIAKRLRIDEIRKLCGRDGRRSFVSLDVLDSDGVSADGSPPHVELDIASIDLEDALERLSDEDGSLIRRRLSGQTFTEIGRDECVSSQRIYQRQQAAASNLHKLLSTT